jgi:putative peptide zinc metalloprotease protein
MPLPPSTTDVERRKKVRLRIRLDLEIEPQRYEGRVYYVVKDPVSLRYYRFKEQERFLIGLMDGEHTLDDSQKEYEKRFRPERLTLEDLESFAQQLLTAGLAQNESPQAGKQLFDRRKKRKRSELMQTLTNILYIKVPIFDPDRLLTWMLPHLKFIYSILFTLVSLSFMIAALLLVITHWDTFYEKLPSYHEFFSFSTVGYLWVALGIVKVIHEFGHGLTCKAFGGEVHEMGALFLVFSPCLYCNVSDAWTLPSKWRRIWISAAGIYVELIIAALSTFIWWNTPAMPFVNNLSLSLMVVCSVSTVVFNANPLMRYDGYYVLADLLEIPNLRERSNRFLQRLAMDIFLGIEVQPEQYMAFWRRVMFVLYAVISYVYRWVVTFSILYFMSRFLKPYKLGVISGMLACGAAGSMIGWPLFRMLKNLNKRGRLPDMKPVRVTLSSIAVACLLLFAFLVPLPVSRLREIGLVQVQADNTSPVLVPDLPNNMPSVILKKLRVRDGQRVEKGQILAEFSCLELQNLLTESKTQRNIYDSQYEQFTSQAEQSTFDPTNHLRLEGRASDSRVERERYASSVKILEAFQSSLEVKAPCDGIVMSPPKIDEVGKMFEKGSSFCSVGDPEQLRVIMPVATKDYRILEDDWEREKTLGRDLGVTIRVKGSGNRIWQGRIKDLPKSDAKDVPEQLTTKYGGPIAAKPSQNPHVHAPASQQFLINVELIDPGAAVCPGSLAYVKIDCRWRTGAWWAWRTFSSAFDLGADWRSVLPGFMRSKD